MKQILLLMLVSICGGCSKNESLEQVTSDFEWRTDFKETFWVNETTGFEYDPACGIMGGAATTAGLNLPSQSVPAETTIIWWMGRREAKNTSVVQRSVVKIPLKTADQELLVFNFSDGKWAATWEEIEDF